MEKHATGKIIYYFSTLRAQHIAKAFNPFDFAPLRETISPPKSFVMLSFLRLKGRLSLIL
jgi:hypothetical protein